MVEADALGTEEKEEEEAAAVGDEVAADEAAIAEASGEDRLKAVFHPIIPLNLQEKIVSADALGIGEETAEVTAGPAEEATAGAIGKKEVVVVVDHPIILINLQEGL